MNRTLSFTFSEKNLLFYFVTENLSFLLPLTVINLRLQKVLQIYKNLIKVHHIPRKDSINISTLRFMPLNSGARGSVIDIPTCLNILRAQFSIRIVFIKYESYCISASMDADK